MAKKRWDSSNPLYRWMHKHKSYKPAAKHVSTVRHMTRHKGKSRRRGRSFLSTSSLFKYVRIGAFVAPAIGGLTANAPWEDKWQGTLAMYTGYHPRYGDFRWDRLMQGWTPFVAATLITFGAQKLGGLIRKL